MKHLIAIVSLLSIVGCSLFKETIKRDDPGIKVIQSDEKVTAFQLSYPNYPLRAEKTPQGTFQRFNPESFPSEHLLFGNEYISMPEIPMYTVFVALPIGAKPEKISVEPTGAKVMQNILLYPVQPEQFATTEEPERDTFRFDQRVYNQAKTMAAEWKNVTQVMEEPYNIYRISVPAVDYDPLKMQLTLYKNFNIRVDYGVNEPCFVKEVRSAKFNLDAMDAHLFKGKDYISDLVINRNVFVKYLCVRDFTPFQLGHQLLIVTTDKFLSAAQDLESHKESLGIRTKVVTTAQILGALGGTITDVKIKNWIKNYNNSSLIRVKWLLIMGDAEYIPTHYISFDENGSKCAGDQYYGQLSGGDLSIPTIGIGRLPIDELADAQRIVDRIKAYELHPPTSISAANTFQSKMSFAAQFQDDNLDDKDDRWFAETSEDIRNYLLGQNYSIQRIYGTPSNVNPRFWNDGTPIPAALRKPGFAWNGNRNDIISAINGGRVIVYHRDHGSKNGWGTPSFGTGDLASLSITGNKYPMVFSINCASGVFDNETANLPGNVTTGMDVTVNGVYWAEKFLLQPNGAIGIVGDTRNSSTVMNNHMAKGLFDAMFPNYQAFGGAAPIYHLGDVLNHAKAYVANTGAGSTAIFKENTIYNLFGDPSLQVVPHPMLLIFPGEWVVKAEKLQIPFKVKNPGCLSCPPIPEISKEPIFAALINPKTGEIISRTLVTKEGNIELPVNNFQGPAILRLSGASVEPMSIEVRL